MKQERINIQELAQAVLKYGEPNLRSEKQTKVLHLLSDHGSTDYTPTDEECAKYDDGIDLIFGLISEV